MALSTMDSVIFDVTETKFAAALDSLYNTAIAFRDCRNKALKVGDPYTKEGVSAYIEYLSLMDRLNVQFSTADDYFALLMFYVNNTSF